MIKGKSLKHLSDLLTHPAATILVFSLARKRQNIFKTKKQLTHDDLNYTHIN